MFSSIQNQAGKLESVRVKETSVNDSVFDVLKKHLRDQQGI